MPQARPDAPNPFALMMNPEDVLEAVGRLDRLETLQRRICRPLDRPQHPHQDGDEQASFDEAIDAAGDEADAD